MATSRCCTKCMKNTNNFSLYLLVEDLQIVYEISSFSEVLYKRCVLKNVSKFTDKLKKMFLKNSAKLTEKHLCRNLFFNKVAG